MTYPACVASNQIALALFGKCFSTLALMPVIAALSGSAADNNSKKFFVFMVFGWFFRFWAHASSVLVPAGLVSNNSFRGV